MAANLMQYEGGYREEFARFKTTPGDVQDITLTNLQYPMGYELLARLCSFESVEALLAYTVNGEPEESAGEEEASPETPTDTPEADIYSGLPADAEDEDTGTAPVEEVPAEDAADSIWPGYTPVGATSPEEPPEEEPDPYAAAYQELAYGALADGFAVEPGEGDKIEDDTDKDDDQAEDDGDDTAPSV